MILKKLAFVLSLGGILLLLFLVIIIPPKEINLAEINPSLLNKQIQTSGQITKIRTYNTSSQNTFQILEIRDLANPLEKIDATLSNPRINLEKNQNITLTGKITLYKNSLQIQVDKITLP